MAALQRSDGHPRAAPVVGGLGRPGLATATQAARRPVPPAAPLRDTSTPELAISSGVTIYTTVADVHGKGAAALEALGPASCALLVTPGGHQERIRKVREVAGRPRSVRPVGDFFCARPTLGH